MNSFSKTILVTGNMGYVGPQVIRELRDAYPEVKLIGLDAGYFAHCLWNAPLLPETQVDVQYFSDVRQVSGDIFQGVDAVVHLAGISNDAVGQAFDHVTYEINYHGTLRLADLAKKAGVRRFIFASSCSLYGFGEEGHRTEQSALQPLTAYAKSKALSEEGLKLLADDLFQVTCLRFATACGMSERLRLDLVINDLVFTAITSQKIQVLSDGSPWRPLIHVRDMGRAIAWAVQRPSEKGGNPLAINVGCDEWNFQVRDLAHAVQRHFPSTTIWINPQASPDQRSYRVHFGLFRSLAPHHQPQVSMEMAIAELKQKMEAALLNGGSSFERTRFIRLHILRELIQTGDLNQDLYFKKHYDFKEGDLSCLKVISAAVSASA